MLKKTLLASAVLLIGSLNGYAATLKLPFIGERHYNFMGGSGTDEFIIINKDGMAYYGGTGDVNIGGIRMIHRKAKFQNPSCDADGCYKYTATTVEMLDENKKPLYQCSESGIFLGESDDPEYQHRCIQKLEKP